MPNPLALDFGQTPQESMAALANAQATADLRRQQVGLTQAQAQKESADAQKAQMEVANMKRMQELMRGEAGKFGQAPGSVPGLNGPQDIAGSLEYMAKLSLESGDLIGAGKLGEQASLIRSHQASAARAEAGMAKDRGAVVQQHLQLVGQLLDASTDQASWDRNNALYAMLTGEASPYAGQPYSRQLVDSIKKQALTTKQQLDDQLKRGDLMSKEQNRQSQENHRAFQENQALALQPFKVDREKRLAKSGGKAIGSPTQRDVDMTYAKLEETMPDISTAERQQKARAVENQVQALMLAHPGLDADTARRQAMQKISAQPGVTFQDGSKPSLALPPPADRNFEAGKYYAVPGKGTYRYMGNDQWELAAQPAQDTGDSDGADSEDNTDAGD